METWDQISLMMTQTETHCSASLKSFSEHAIFLQASLEIQVHCSSPSKLLLVEEGKKEANNTQGSTLKVGIQRPSESMTGQKPRSKILHIYLTWQIGHESREKLQYGLEGIYWLLISREVVRLLFLCLWEEKAAVL